ncbi:MAG: nuclear transport factor 2 family protein [Burkholderiaceae bacterium]
MHPNEELLTRFYTAFAKRDAATMAACYAPGATFEDPAFELVGSEIGMMWKMLCENAKDDFRLEFSRVVANDETGSAHWEPRYTFSASGRQVHNIIDSSFVFKDSLIIAQEDKFSFWRWASQALGAPGLLLGWLPMMRSKVRVQADKNLAKFIAKQKQLAQNQK